MPPPASRSRPSAITSYAAQAESQHARITLWRTIQHGPSDWLRPCRPPAAHAAPEAARTVPAWLHGVPGMVQRYSWRRSAAFPAARERGHGVSVCRARAPVTAPAPLLVPSRILSPILVTSWALCCYVHPGCFMATCYPILSPPLPARMSPGMQLTAEVPAWLSSVSRIVVRYANKIVILGNTVVTKHEHWGRTWPHFTASALALTPRRRKGRSEEHTSELQSL